MNNPHEKVRSEVVWTTREVTKMALVAALYVAVTFVLQPVGYGNIQFRVAEMFNFLALANKRYVWAVTIGCGIANLASPNGLLDVVVGSSCTFFVLLLCRWATRNMKSLRLKLAVTAFIFALSMFTVAAQLTLLYQAPFFFNWLTIGIGELLSMTIGGILIYLLAQKINLTI
ncbi:QueT transporter family protein [Enterococcus sp.]|uniref:QueT transporter family protein n=1 Tax=Enterococcus sp. TaxID=35783 RepID=UPI003C75E1EB